MQSNEELDRKCNVYASENPLQKEPKHDDYSEESNADSVG